MPAFSLLPAPRLLPVPLPRWQNAPLPIPAFRRKFHGFGAQLSPVQFSAQDHWTSELLRTL